MFKTLYILAMALLLTNPAAAQAKKKDSGKRRIASILKQHRAGMPKRSLQKSGATNDG